MIYKPTKVNDAYSSWKEYILWCPTGIHTRSFIICDPFYYLEDLDIATYADDTIIYTVNKKKELLLRKRVIIALETSPSLLFG